MSAEPVEPWVSQFADHLFSPDAVGDLVWSIVGAAVAFIGAILLFRRQLAHDRALFRDQLEAERTFRRSEMRRPAARRLGEALISVAGELGNLNPMQLWDELEPPRSALHVNQAPGSRLLYDEYNIVKYELDLDESLLDIWRARSQWWRDSSASREDVRVRRLGVSKSQSVIYNVVEDRFIILDELLEDLGQRLLRWDGEGDIPTIDNNQLTSPFTYSGSPDHPSSLTRQLRNEQERTARSVSRRTRK